MRSPLRAAVLASALALAFAGPSAAAEATPGWDLVVDLTPETVTVGDRVHVTLTLTGQPSVAAAEPRFPAWADSWGAAEILEVGPVEREASPGAGSAGTSGLPDGAVRWRQRLVLAAFHTGRVDLPPRSVTLSASPSTEAGPPRRTGLPTPESLGFRVESVLPDGVDPEEVEVAPPAPIRPLPMGETFWWTLGVAGLLAAVAVGAGVLRTRAGAAREEAAGRLLPAYDELLARLDELTAPEARSPTEAAAAIERCHEELSLALRHYLGRCLGFPATESTTTEVRYALRSRPIPDPVVLRADEVLRSCDRVKFAREVVAGAALEDRVEATRELARRLELHLHPPTAGAREASEEAA